MAQKRAIIMMICVAVLLPVPLFAQPADVLDALPAARATLRDPLQRSDDIISHPPQNLVDPIPAYAANRSAQPLKDSRIFGNPRDPLGAAKCLGIPTAIVSPYIEMIHDARLHDIFFVSPQIGWTVGDHGAIWHTRDAGKTWELQITPFDGKLHTVHFENAENGVALGSYAVPLTNIRREIALVTNDGGKKWTEISSLTEEFIEKIRARRAREKSASPKLSELRSFPPMINAAFAIDPQNGWGVGELGTILYTTNGGKSWSVQRRGGKRLAALICVPTAEEIPWELLTHLASEKGYLCGVWIASAQESSQETDKNAIDDAVMRTGAVTILFADTLFSGSRTNLHQNTNLLRNSLVQEILLWRPEVVFATQNGLHSATQNGLQDNLQDSSSWNTMVEEAITHAASVSNQESKKGLNQESFNSFLPAWQVNKHIVLLPYGVHGKTMLTSRDIQVRLGISLAEAAWNSRAFVGRESAQRGAPAVIGMQTESTSRVNVSHPTDPMSGLVLLPDSGARRFFIGTEMPQIEAAQMRQKWQEEFANLLDSYQREMNEKGIPLAPRALAIILSPLMQQVNPDVFARTLWTWSETQQRRGAWNSAVVARLLLIEKYPQHPLARDALEQLSIAGTSEEIAIRLAQNTSESENFFSERASWCAYSESIFAATWKDFFASPKIRLLQAARRRADGTICDNENLFNFDLVHKNSSTYSPEEAALYAREHWIASRASLANDANNKDAKNSAPFPILRCKRTQTRPFLDGDFSEESDPRVWFAASLHPISESHDSLGTRMMILYDDEFLYLGIRAPFASEHSYLSRAESPRMRDTDLTQTDRVEIEIDVDRCGSLAYQLILNERGWVNDLCGNDATWDPRWYVACAADNKVDNENSQAAWMIEAAIPLSALTRIAPRAGSMWGVRVKRCVGTARCESWGDRDQPPPEKFGIILFE